MSTEALLVSRVESDFEIALEDHTLTRIVSFKSRNGGPKSPTIWDWILFQIHRLKIDNLGVASETRLPLFLFHEARQTKASDVHSKLLPQRFSSIACICQETFHSCSFRLRSSPLRIPESASCSFKHLSILPLQIPPLHIIRDSKGPNLRQYTTSNQPNLFRCFFFSFSVFFPSSEGAANEPPQKPKSPSLAHFAIRNINLVTFLLLLFLLSSPSLNSPSSSPMMRQKGCVCIYPDHSPQQRTSLSLRPGRGPRTRDQDVLIRAGLSFLLQTESLWFLGGEEGWDD
ncbi:unnamed protein product [Diplocarpon coronariae]